jgi:hypothetical protein
VEALIVSALCFYNGRGGRNVVGRKPLTSSTESFIVSTDFSTSTWSVSRNLRKLDVQDVFEFPIINHTGIDWIC